MVSFVEKEKKLKMELRGIARPFLWHLEEQGFVGRMEMELEGTLDRVGFGAHPWMRVSCLGVKMPHQCVSYLEAQSVPVS